MKIQIVDTFGRDAAWTNHTITNFRGLCRVLTRRNGVLIRFETVEDAKSFGFEDYEGFGSYSIPEYRVQARIGLNH